MGTASAEPTIDVENLRFSYGRREALHGISFSIRRGEIFGLLGPSGAGKSTTQNILTGLLRGHSGRAAVFGREPAAWGASYYERIGVAFELPTHFRKLTALENLAYFRALYRSPALTPEQALALVGLEDSGRLRVEQFSKGMQNRLSVARAILHGPELLFLDEPTSGLDPVSALRIRELIEAQRRAGTTIFLTTHNMALAEEICDHVAFLLDGTIRLIDTPRALRLRYGAPVVAVEHGGAAGLTCERFALAGLGQNERFLELLRGGDVQTIHTCEASLEQIFVDVTGGSLQ